MSDWNVKQRNSCILFCPLPIPQSQPFISEKQGKMITNTTPTHREAEEGKEAEHSQCFGGEIKKALLPTQASSEGA